MTTRYVPGPAIDDPVAMVTVSGGAKEYFHTNKQGSIVSDGGKARIEGPYTYDPYGNCFSGGSACTSSGEPYRFTGRRFDAETGLYYYRARYYWPIGGRFMQADSVGYVADLNLYTYGTNDPIDKRDPTGLVPGDLFDTPEEVGNDALLTYNQRSISENREYSAPVIRAPNGKFFSAPAVAGHGDNFTWTYTGSAGDIWGDWHTHGDYSIEGPDGLPRRTGNPHQDSYNSDHFSTKDKLNSQSLSRKSGNPHYKSYLGTSSGAFKQYDPKTGQETTMTPQAGKPNGGTQPPPPPQTDQAPPSDVCSPQKGGCGPGGGADEWGGGHTRGASRKRQIGDSDMWSIAGKSALFIGAIIIIAVAPSGVSVKAQPPPSCTIQPGTLPGPLVPTENVAREIYKAIARGLRPRTWRKYPIIFVLDQGDKWAVGQTTAIDSAAVSSPRKHQSEEQTVTVHGGGGNLEMEIDKCTGSVSAHLAR